MLSFSSSEEDVLAEISDKYREIGWVFIDCNLYGFLDEWYYV